MGVFRRIWDFISCKEEKEYLKEKEEHLKEMEQNNIKMKDRIHHQNIMIQIEGLTFLKSIIDMTQNSIDLLQSLLIENPDDLWRQKYLKEETAELEWLKVLYAERMESLAVNKLYY
jgi:hypothetical protein